MARAKSPCAKWPSWLSFSTTVVYGLFQDKATLITQAMDEDLLALVKAMRHAVDPALSPVENIKRVGHAYVTFGLRHPDQYALVFMERRPHAPVENSNVEHGNQAQDPYAFGVQLFVELAASGLVRSDAIESMAQIFWEGIHGMTSLRLVFGDKEMWFEHDAFMPPHGCPDGRPDDGHPAPLPPVRH
ncbi:WHG domain-containing protein [Massilia sp. H-1]|nr:WHG domain-containing protein [Massilia sp. H-1]